MRKITVVVLFTALTAGSAAHGQTITASSSVLSTVSAARTASAGSDDLWTPGESFNLDADDLFTSTGTVQVAARSSSENVGVATSGSTITVTSMKVGTATVTITGTVGSAFTSTQTISNIATISFDLTVDELPLEITLSIPAVTTLVEGDSMTLTLTANKALTSDTAVSFTRISGTADVGDYEAVLSVTMTAGSTNVTTALVAKQDFKTEPAETLTLEGRFGNGDKTNQVAVNIHDRVDNRSLTDIVQRGDAVYYWFAVDGADGSVLSTVDHSITFEPWGDAHFDAQSQSQSCQRCAFLVYTNYRLSDGAWAQRAQVYHYRDGASTMVLPLESWGPRGYHAISVRFLTESDFRLGYSVPSSAVFNLVVTDLSAPAPSSLTLHRMMPEEAERVARSWR